MFRVNMCKRQKSILRSIMIAQKPIKSRDLADEFGVSLRTIQNDIRDIRYYLKENNIQLYSKPSVGFWVEVEDEQKNEILDFLLKDKDYSEKYIREEYMLYRILNYGESFTIQDFADELYVSPTTVYRSLNIVEGWLSKYNLKLNRKKGSGVRLIGDEKDIRYALVSCILEKISDYMIDDHCIKDKDKVIDRLNYVTRCLDNITEGDIKQIIFIMNRTLDTYGMLLIDSKYYNILINLVINVSRIRKRKYVAFKQNKKIDLYNTKEHEIAIYILNQIEKQFSLDYIEDEIYYLLLILIGNRIDFSSKLSTEQYNSHEIEKYSTEEIAKEIIHYIEEQFNIELMNDEKLLMALELHLISTIESSKYGAKMVNPLLNEIKINYPYSFNVAVEIIDKLNENYNIKMNENNAGYIALHIQAAIEKSKLMEARSINTYLICNSGMGFVHLLSIQINKWFDKINIVKMTSERRLKEEFKEFLEGELPELIISTVPLSMDIEEANIPIVKVSPILTDKDIEDIDHEIKKIISNKREEAEERSILKSYIHEDIIYSDLSADSSEELIEKVCDDMCSKGYVTSQFKDSVVEREKLSCTYVANCVVVPHGKAEFVLVPSIALITLNEPIIWYGYKVNTVFLCALDLSVDKVSNELFQELYRIIGDKKLLKEITEKKLNQ